MRSGICHITAFYILMGIFFLIACKKTDEQPYVPLPECTIVEPGNGSVIQAAEIIAIKAELEVFGDSAEVKFIIADILDTTISAAPYGFMWKIPEALSDTLNLQAIAIEGNRTASDSITIFIIDTITPKIKPVPVLSVSPAAGTIDTIFIFDASASFDASTAPEDLLFRFDFDGDEEWDTDFTAEPFYEFKYSHPGNYRPVLEVKDTDGLFADTSLTVPVQHGNTTDPCEGYYSVFYVGKVYHTVRIGEQCWLRENLDVGVMIPAGEDQGNNQLIEKYCYDNDSLNCDIYGGLYQWREAMNHLFPISAARGLCPSGYHIPSDEEWRTLEAFIDSQHDLFDDIWNVLGFRGYDAGKRMKAMLSWVPGSSGNNLSLFTALASGSWREGEGFTGEGRAATYWSTSHISDEEAFTRSLGYNEDGISMDHNAKRSAFSVRCIKD